MQVSIIIVNYKNPPLIVQCVKSIVQFEKTINYEIIVVDNDSQDDTEQQLRTIYPNLKWIQMGYNSGFAKANNAGIKIAKGKYIFFLNADTILVEPVFETLIDCIEKEERVGIVGCQLLNKDGSLQLSYHNGDLFFQKLWRRNPLTIKFFNATGKNKKDNIVIRNNHSKIHNTRWLCGAVLLIKKSILEENKFYWSEDFFMYWEDVELCYRIRKKGFNVCYIPISRIIHLNGGGVDCSGSRFVMREQSKLKCIGLVRGKLYKAIYLVLYKMELRFEMYLERRNKTANPKLNIEADFYGIK